MTDQGNSQEAEGRSTHDKGTAIPPRGQTGRVKCMNPNTLSFRDDRDFAHKIFIPRGKFDEVCKLYVNKDWKTLAKFPAWTGAADQQYTEEDYFYAEDEETKDKD